MTAEHKDLDYLKGKFEDGDRPTGEDFARLIDSCHNTRHLTDTTITSTLSVQGGLTVDGNINTRDVAADGSKLDSLDSFVRNNSDSWEETADIQLLTTQLQTVSSALSDDLSNVNITLSARVDSDNTVIHTRVDDLQASLTTHIDDNIQSLTGTVETNNTNINNLVTSNHSDINTRVDGITSDINTRVDGVVTGLGDTQSAVNQVTSTVFSNSAAWGVDENTNSLNNLLDVEIGTIEHSAVLKFDADDGIWRPATDLHGEGQHVDTFLELHDTSVAYTGANKFVKINETNTGLTFAEHTSDDWDSTTSTVRTNSGSWSDAYDWGDHAVANYLTDYTVTQSDVTDHQAALTITEAQISDFGTYLTDYTVTQSDVTDHQAALSVTESQISDLGSYLTDYTVTQSDVTDHQAALSVTESQISDLGSYLTSSDIVSSNNWSSVYTVVSAQSANWADHVDTSTLEDNLSQLQSTVNANGSTISTLGSDFNTLQTLAQDNESNISDIGEALATTNSNVTQVTTTVNNNSGNWAVLDNTGKLLESQIPELSITQTYTVQNTEEVATLNPAEGIQRGDIVIVYNTYDNLVAKQDNPTGTYDASTKSYTGYSKLARPDAYVTAVNDKYGNVVLTSDDIDDTDNTNKWVDQTDIDRWNSNLSTTGGTMAGDLDTTASYLSGGTDLKNIFWSKGDNVSQIGNWDVVGTVTANTYATEDPSGDKVTGITDNVNVGGNILHIVNGIIVGITDET